MPIFCWKSHIESDEYHCRWLKKMLKWISPVSILGISVNDCQRSSVQTLHKIINIQLFQGHVYMRNCHISDDATFPPIVPTGEYIAHSYFYSKKLEKLSYVFYFRLNMNIRPKSYTHLWQCKCVDRSGRNFLPFCHSNFNFSYTQNNKII